VPTSNGTRRWQKDWLKQLRESGTLSADHSGQPIDAPKRTDLFGWLIGGKPPADGPRKTHWFRSHRRTVTHAFKRDGRHELSLVVPPHGSVTEATFDITFEGPEGARLRIDIGCDGEAEAHVAPGEKAEIDVTEPVKDYLMWRERHFAGPQRTGNGWRIVPVAFSLSGDRKDASFTASGVRVVSSQ
jgi:hypothetical protein